MKTTVLLGPPGTGKTTSLLDLLGENLQQGVLPDKIGFLSFTRRATEEARDRAIARFSLRKEDFPYFRTMHSLAFQQLGLSLRRVMGRANYQEFSRALGIELSGSKTPEEDGIYDIPDGDRMLFLSGLARVSLRPLKEIWERYGENLDFLEIDRFDRALSHYKEAKSLMDFNDMLSSFAEAGPFPTLDLLIVDEAQDLSALQWKVVRKLQEKSTETYLAGDDDQAIFQWSGADVETFVNFPGEPRVLDRSYRLPLAVHGLATRLSESIVARREKPFLSDNRQGSVRRIGQIEDAPLETGDWLILVRNNYLANEIEEYCQEMGLHFSRKGKEFVPRGTLEAIIDWEMHRKRRESTVPPGTYTKYISGAPNHLAPWYEAMDRIPQEEAAYFRAAFSRREKLHLSPRIRISTIHGAKGGEAENVLLCTDMSARTHDGMERDRDAETRVWYVGVTRAKENLFILEPQTERYFEL